MGSSNEPVSKITTRKSSRGRLFVLGLLMLVAVSSGVYFAVERAGPGENTGVAGPGARSGGLAETLSELTRAPDEDDKAPTAAREEDASRTADAADQEPAAPTPVPLEPAPPELAISGAVLDDRGTLLPGIEVKARRVSGTSQEQGTAPSSAQSRSQFTDTLGGFVFENLDEGEYELTVAENADYRAARLRVRAGIANAEIVLLGIHSVTVYGTVTDEVGNPLENVRIAVLGGGLPARSGIAGEYEIQAQPKKVGQAPVLDFSLEGYRDARHRAQNDEDPRSDEIYLDVQLRREPPGPEVEVAGLITGPAGEPVEGARVWLGSSETRMYRNTLSGDAGEYQFAEIEAGSGFRLGVDPQENYAAFESDVFTLGPDGLQYDVALETMEYSNVSGKVIDLEGKPLKGFTLWLRSLESRRHDPQPIKTDAGGAFYVEGVPSGAVSFESRSQPWLVARGVELKPAQNQQVELPMDWGGEWLLGRVVDEQDNPVSNARIVLRWSQQFLDVSSESRREVRSDFDGYFAVSNLGADHYVLTVQADGHVSSRLELPVGESDEEVRIVLPRRGSPGA